METRQKHIALIIVVVSLLLFNKQAVCAFNSDADSTLLLIEFNCEILYNGASLTNGDIINVSGNMLTAGNVDSSGIYAEGTNLIVYVIADSAVDLTTDNSQLSFEFYNSRNQCISTNVEYTIDNERSGPDRLIINSCIISDHYFNYADDVFCVGEGIVYPETDIPEGHVKIVPTYGLVTKDSLAIDTDNSVSGNYSIYINTDFCVDETSDSIEVLIAGTSSDFIPDSILQCGFETEMITTYQGYNVYEAGSVDGTIVTATFEKSGYYVFKPIEANRCVTAETAYVQVVDLEDINISTEEYCNKVVLNVDSGKTDNSNIGWSNGDRSQNTEVYETSNITVVYEDEYGCVQTKSIDVEVNPLVVNEVEYAKEESDCWENGSIEIQNIITSYGLGDYEYALINTITSIKDTTLNDVPEGVYLIEVIDDRGCNYIYPEEITVKQKCHEEYPVFSPDHDGREDEYFIPHEGTVKIYNRDGTLLKELETPAYWDGTDFSGKLMPMGNYVMITETGRVVNVTVVR